MTPILCYGMHSFRINNGSKHVDSEKFAHTIVTVLQVFFFRSRES